MMQRESIQSHLTTLISIERNKNGREIYSLLNQPATSIASLKVGGSKERSMP
jgi:hypothetical protein